MKRCGYLIFAGLLCLVLFAACTGRKSPVGTEDSAMQSGLLDTDMTAEEKLGVPETADYGGETFNILSAGNVAWEDFKFDEESSLALDNAQYKRKALVEQNYNVDIVQTTKKAYSSGGGPGFMQISTDVNAGELQFLILR